MQTRSVPGVAPESLALAVRTLAAGGLVAFPTDTVYGLGAIVSDARAIERLYEVKGRDHTKAIAVLVGNLVAAEWVTGKMSTTARVLADTFWPGPLTLVVHASHEMPANLSPTTSVGIRMPEHPLALELLLLCGPLAVTSANLSGKPDSRTAQQVFDQLKGRIPLILDGGETPGGRPSTVVACTEGEPTILRQGPITLEQLQAAISLNRPL